MSESLQNEFENMMAYSLGEGWSDINIKNSPDQFNTRHSSCGPLVRLEGKSQNYTAAFFIFQMTLFWLEHESVDYVLRDPQYNTTLSENPTNENIPIENPSVFSYIGDMWTSLRTKFKRSTGR